VHWQVIKLLLDNFQNILIPIFNVQNMVKKADRKIGKKSVRAMLTWSHYLFRMRLMEKAKFTDSNVFVVSEKYTTKTCTNCMRLHPTIGGNKFFKCPHCNVKMERDLAAGRNIFLKNVTCSSHH
jgi:putative transposase